ncbi:MAG: S-layer homology domain-containing protein [Leptolyngbyaceae cyanobacterium MO_188.B28]|nr:S-layer homology domain-containing protein [Leptolyngbyaceae cyanobacterium MO_188.B28]
MLDSDEFTAVFVALISIGLILLWVLSRTETGEMAGLQPPQETPRTDTAPQNESSGEQSPQTSRSERSEALFPLQIFQNQPNISDKITGLDHSEPLISPNAEQVENKQAPWISGQAIAPLSIPSEGADPSSPNSTLNLQTDGNASGSTPTPADSTGLSGQLPELPSQSVLEQPIETPTIAESTDLPAIAPSTDPKEFSDVPDEYWAKSFIDALSSRELLSGFPDGTFQPDKPVTRAELAAQIAKVFMLEGRQSAQAFVDIPQNYWADAAIKEAVSAGFMRGYPQETFKPEQAVSRAQLLVAIVSGLGLLENSEPAAVMKRYQDRDEIPAWALSKIAAATETELVVNYPNLERFQPNKPATRAEVSAILTRALVYQGRLEDSPSRYIVRP